MTTTGPISSPVSRPSSALDPTPRSFASESGLERHRSLLDAQDDGRVKITVAHDKLPTADAVEEWKGYWSDWLAAVDEA